MPVNTLANTDPTAPEPGTSSSTAPQGNEAQQSLARMAGLDPKVAVGSGPGQPAADQTRIVVIDGHEAAASDPGTAMHGMAHATAAGEVAGGNIQAVLDPPADTSITSHPLTKERAALLSPVARAISPYIQRPVTEWGIIGPGDIIRGHMLLVDLHTGKKVRAMDGHRVGIDELYANLRNFPEALSTGDTIEKLMGAS